MYYNKTHNQLLLIYIKVHLKKGLENTRVVTKEWGKTEFKEKTKKNKNLKKTIYTIKNTCVSH